MKRAWRWPLAGFVVGALVGATILTVNVIGASSPVRPPAGTAPSGRSCTRPRCSRARVSRSGCGTTSSAECPGSSPPAAVRRAVRCSCGQRVGRSTSSLRFGATARGLLSATVGASDAAGGFDYYARIDNGRGQSAELPGGATDAPQHVWPIESRTRVDLGATRFGRTRAPDAVVASFPWGKSDRAAGLDSGPEQARIGPSAFDVAPDGSVVVLDQVNRRLAIVRPESSPAHCRSHSMAVRATSPSRPTGRSTCSTPPAFRCCGRSAAGGYPVAATRLAEQTADMVRVGPSGPLVHAYPSEMWLSTGAARPPAHSCTATRGR